MAKASLGIKVTIIGIIINALLAAIKISAGILGNTYALIADGIESTTDIFSSIIVWSGLKIASKPPDINHPYGHGKAEAVSAMFVSLLLVAAAVYIVIHSIHEIITPHHSPAPFTLFVLVLVVITKETLYRKVFKVGGDIHSTAVKSDAWHHRSDALTSVAAFIGIAIALIGGKGYESADDWAALLASGIIVYNGVRMFMASLSDIMDETPSGELKSNIIKIAKSTPGVLSVKNIKVRKSGLEYLVDLDIQVNGNMSITEGHNIAEEVNDILKKSDLSIQEVMVHIEPFGR